MNKTTINGVTISGGNNIVIQNGKIIVDGKDVTPDSKNIKIEITGNVKELKVDTCDSVNITGDSGSVNTLSGDVEINGSVNGNVKTMSGDVICDNILGAVSTMSGNIGIKSKRKFK